MCRALVSESSNRLTGHRRSLGGSSKASKSKASSCCCSSSNSSPAPEMPSNLLTLTMPLLRTAAHNKSISRRESRVGCGAAKGKGGPSRSSTLRVETVGDELPLAWPDVAQDQPFNEFTSDNYLTCGCPALFPTGKAQLRQTRRRTAPPQVWKVSEQPPLLILLCSAQFRFEVEGPGHCWGLCEEELPAPHPGGAAQPGAAKRHVGLARLAQIMVEALRGTRQYCSGVRGKAYAWLTFLEYEFDQMPTLFYTISVAETH